MATITFANVRIGGSIQALNPVSEGFNVNINANVNFEDRSANRTAQQQGITRSKTFHADTYNDAKAQLANQFDNLESALTSFVTDWNNNQPTGSV